MLEILSENGCIPVSMLFLTLLSFLHILINSSNYYHLEALCISAVPSASHEMLKHISGQSSLTVLGALPDV
jgi:hypothetical protein